MNAKIKATGEIVEVYHYGKPYYIEYIGEKPGRIFYPEELDLLDNNPDYWTRLEHQAAIGAMQGMSEKYLKDYRDYCAGFGDMDKDEAKATMKDFADAMADVCYYFAHALVEKYKKEERK